MFEFSCELCKVYDVIYENDMVKHELRVVSYELKV